MMIVGSFLLKGVEYSLFVFPFLSFSWSELVVSFAWQYLFVFLIPGFLSTILMWNFGGVFAAAWVQWRARLIVRREIERGTCSFHTLENLFGDDLKFLLSAFFRDPPKAHHEMAQS
jgi:hypothetical protein